MWDCGKRVRDRERPNDRAESFRKFNCPPWILAILPYALESICESQDFLWKRQLRKVKVLFRELPKVRGEPEWARYYIFLLLIRAAVRNRHRKLSFSNIPSFHSFSTQHHNLSSWRAVHTKKGMGKSSMVPIRNKGWPLSVKCISSFTLAWGPSTALTAF